MARKKKNNKTSLKLTVLFEEPFYVGYFERSDEKGLSYSKVVFGKEPKDGEVYDFVLKNIYSLRFSPSIEGKVKDIPKNPKRALKESQKQVENTSGIKKSWQALKLQQEENKLIRKKISKEEKLAEEERLFELKRQKKKEKHKGR